MSERLEGLALRCLMPGFVGTVAPEWILRRAAQGLGGVVLYARNVESREQLAALTSRLHAERAELVIAIDEEGGDVTRLEAREGSSFPGNLALGAADDLELTQEVAAAMGAELAAVGVDLDLAPDADVNTNPSNPVIGVRAFGSDPSRVAAHTAAWIHGLQGAGVAACAKHFPGHGDTSVDSHLALPVVGADPHAGALRPFEAAIAAGVRAVMSAHIVVQSLDPESPATVSRRIMSGLLRDELGFDGLVITDGLEMRGLTDGVEVSGAAVRALAAGCDALCIGGGLAGEDVVEETRRAITGAVGSALSESRLADAASRVDGLSAWRRANTRTPQRDAEVGLVAARRAIRADGQVRIKEDARVLKLESPISMAAGDIPWGLANALMARGVQVESVEVHSGSFDPDRVTAGLDGRSLVLVVRNLHRDATQLRIVEALLARHPEAVTVEMGYPACRPAAARAYIATHGAARVCAQAAAELMRP